MRQSLLRRIVDRVEAAGNRGAKIGEIARAFGHQTTKLVEKCVGTLVTPHTRAYAWF